MTAIVIVSLVALFYVMNPPIRGAELPHDLSWGYTNEQVRMADSSATVLREEWFFSEQFATSLKLTQRDFYVWGEYSTPVYYFFGWNDSLNKIELRVPADEAGTFTKYHTIKKKLERYYNAVCKVTATKTMSDSGDDEIYTWYTPNSIISFSYKYKTSDDAITIVFTPSQELQAEFLASDDETSITFDIFQFNESVFQADFALMEWFECIAREWKETPSGHIAIYLI